MNIITNQNSVTHNTSVRNGSIQYIVIHYTATDKATGANEVAYFSKKTTRNASADFFVDGENVYQYNPDPSKRYAWAVGGKKLATGGGSMHGKITNRNSVSIEMCCYKENGVWKITDQTYQTTIDLARLLRYLCQLPAGRVYRHYDVTGKLCPNVEGFISPQTRWDAMKAAIDSDTATTATATQTVSTASSTVTSTVSGAQDVNIKVRVLVDDLVIRTAPNGDDTGRKTGKGEFTIVKLKDGWGYLKSGAGWIYINNSAYVTRLDGTTATTAAVKHRFSLAVDGSLGSASVKALQSWLGTTVDGVVSGQYSGNKKYLAACPTSCWKFSSKATGSAMIRALQKHLGITADGVAGKGTVKALQTWLGVTADGYLGKNTAKALQRYLNAL